MLYRVKDYINLSPVCVNLKDEYHKIVQTMKNNNVTNVFVVDNEKNFCGIIFKKDLIKGKRKSYHTAKEILEPEMKFINAYPENNLNDVLTIMNDLNLECIPVCRSTSDKQLIGFVQGV